MGYSILTERIAMGLLILLPIAAVACGPYLLRPMSQGPKTRFLANFTLIDVAALVWLLSLVPLLLRGLLEIFWLLAGVLSYFNHHTREDLFLGAANSRGSIILMIGISLILVAIWASGVRQLGAHNIRNWKARGSYLGIAIPLAYLCPACLCLSLALMSSDRQLSGFWGLLLVMFSLLAGVIARGICVLAIRTSLPAAAPKVVGDAQPSVPFGK